MARFRRFEVKREMQDGGNIRPDDNNYKQNGGKSSLEQQQEIEREANQVGGFDDFDYDEVVEEDFDAHTYFLERAGTIDFLDIEENKFMEEYANTIISEFPNISHDDASALLLYVTRSEANRQGILDNIRVRIDDKTKVGSTRFKGIEGKQVVSEIVFSEKELIDGVNNGNMEAYVTGIGHLVESACHEVEHAKQNSKIYAQNPELNYETLRMAKESIVARVKPEFYRKNYRSYTMEKNAFLNGRMQEKKALQNLQGVLPDELYSKIERRIDELIEFDKSADTTTMRIEDGGYTDIDSADMVLTDITDGIMPMYATDALDKYPILAFQYREDGTKKDLTQLLQDRDAKIQQLEESLTAIPSRKIEVAKEIDSIRNFYTEIIQGDRQLLAQRDEMDKQQSSNNETMKQEETSIEYEGEHNTNIYQYTDMVEKLESGCVSLYFDYLTDNDIEPTEELQKDFVGKIMGKEYSKLFEDENMQQLAQIYGRLDYEALYDTKMNYDERFTESTHQKYLLGLQQVQTENGNVFIAKYEESKEEGQPFEMIYQYYALDENGQLQLLENVPQFDEKQTITTLTQSEIANRLEQRKDIISSLDEKLLENLEKRSHVKNNQEQLKENAADTIQLDSSFESILLQSGFSESCIKGVKSTIKSVNPRTLVATDKTLSRTNEQTLSIGGNEDRNEQDYR